MRKLNTIEKKIWFIMSQFFLYLVIMKVNEERSDCYKDFFSMN